MKRTLYARYGKQWFDAVVALGGLILLSPLLLIVAIAVRLDTPGTSFFLQARTGRLGRTFQIIKFRTMKQVVSGEARLITATGDCRVTRVGSWLRKTKVDELPQLLNVIVGEMSLVGPRPEVPKYTRLYTEEQSQVLLERPGITSRAALAYVNEEEILAQQDDAENYYVRHLMPMKLELDLEYCRKVSFFQDMSLIGRTLGRLLQPRQRAIAAKSKLTTNLEELS